MADNTFCGISDILFPFINKSFGKPLYMPDPGCALHSHPIDLNLSSISFSNLRPLALALLAFMGLIIVSESDNVNKWITKIKY